MAVSWMRTATIIGTVRSWWTSLWGRYHVPQNVFLVSSKFTLHDFNFYSYCKSISIYKCREMAKSVIQFKLLYYYFCTFHILSYKQVKNC